MNDIILVQLSSIIPNVHSASVLIAACIRNSNPCVLLIAQCTPSLWWMLPCFYIIVGYLPSRHLQVLCCFCFHASWWCRRNSFCWTPPHWHLVPHERRTSPACQSLDIWRPDHVPGWQAQYHRLAQKKPPAATFIPYDPGMVYSPTVILEKSTNCIQM